VRIGHSYAAVSSYNSPREETEFLSRKVNQPPGLVKAGEKASSHGGVDLESEYLAGFSLRVVA
jgi:hypothetical protein